MARKFIRFMGKSEYDKLLSGETLVHPKPKHLGYTNSMGFCFFEVDNRYGDDLHCIQDYYEFTEGVVDEYTVVVFESDGDGLFEGYGTYADPYGSFWDTINVDEYSTLSYSRETMVPIRSYRHFSKYDKTPIVINEL